MKRISIGGLLIVLSWMMSLSAQVTVASDPVPPLKPIRTVESQTVTSTRDPAVKITVPKEARYAGADRWILFGVADCEIHVYFEADANKQIKRVYWIQFEGYLPSKPNLRYKPKSGRVSLKRTPRIW